MLWIIFLTGVFGTAGNATMIVMGMIFGCFFCEIRENVIGVVVFFIIGVVGALGFVGVDFLTYEETTKCGEWELIAMSDDNQNSDAEGTNIFYVYTSRSGFSNEDSYSFYYRLNNGKYKKGSEFEKNTTVIETLEADEGTPRFVQYKVCKKNKMNKVLRLILTLDNEEECWYKCELYIPKGTIRREFKLYSLSIQERPIERWVFLHL